ncbi:FKBP-type peptidyl-prolyl cis-trans isomerase [soil metagenome]
MKMIVAAVAALLLISYNAESQVNNVKLETKKDSASYALGLNIAKSLKAQELDLDIDRIAAGLRDGLGGTAMMKDEEVAACLTALQAEAQKKAQEKASMAGGENLKKGEAFLAENKKKPGVMTTASGLQYKVVTEGKGKKPIATNTVKVHYKGTNIDGKVFDSSYDRGQPAEFALNQVIPGWTEGLQLMNAGSKYILYIPSQIAYGENGAGGAIGPNEALVFEVELLEIK